MQLTELIETYQTRRNIEVFNGYNHNISIGEGEFYDMHDMSTVHFPAMSTREKHGTRIMPSTGTHKINGMIDKKALCYVDGQTLYINDEPFTNLILEDSPKQLVSMGAYIVIFPDKVYVNTEDTSDYGSIEAEYKSEGKDVTYTMCTLEGDPYNVSYRQATEPSNPSAGAYWIDTSSTPHVLKQYSASTSMWTQIPTTYVKIASSGIGTSFKEYDGVYISGIPSSIGQVSEINDKTSVLYKVEDGYVMVVGFIDETKTVSDHITIERRMPVMDFVVESNNRLWGCRYGRDRSDTKVVNEIYASKLGDCRNWNCFMGVSTDSYAVSVGTDGQFTGAVSYGGYPIFFKENVMHKLYGNYPANYQVQTTPCRGVQKGAGDSLVVVGEALLYKTRNGVAIYEGSLPTEISSAFGGIKYTGKDGNDSYRSGAVAGKLGQKYYISMKSEADDKWYTFSFDLQNNMWMKEFEGKVLQFCEHDGEMFYLLDRSSIKTWNGSGDVDSDPVEWMVESGRIGTNSPEKKYISRYIVRMMLDVGTRANVFIEYDSEGKWRHIQTLKGTNMRTQSFPIRPRRCDHFRIRIEGKGGAKIFSVTKFIEEGSDK